MPLVKKEELKQLSVMDLLTARDEAISARDDVQNFYDLRYNQVDNPNDSNPRGLPTLRYKLKSDIVSQQVREAGFELENIMDDFDVTIDRLTEELVTRCK